MLTKHDLAVMSYGMSNMAATHKDDRISNALARVSQKLESYGKAFASELTEQDFQVIHYYRAHQYKD